jgi:hypothetical protein
MKNHSRALRFFSVETSGDYLSQMCPPFFSIYHSFRMVTLWKRTVEICQNHVYRCLPLSVGATATKLGIHMEVLMCYILDHLTIDRSLMVWLIEEETWYFQLKSEILPLLVQNATSPSVFELESCNLQLMPNIPEIIPLKSSVFDFLLRLTFVRNFFQILTIFIGIHISSKMYIFNIWLLISPELHALKEIRRRRFFRNLVLFPSVPVPSLYDQKKVRLGESDGLSINEAHGEIKLDVGVGAVTLIPLRPKKKFDWETLTNYR